MFVRTATLVRFEQAPIIFVYTVDKKRATHFELKNVNH